MKPTRGLLDGVLKYKTLFSETPDAENHFVFSGELDVLEFVLDGPEFRTRLTPGRERNVFRSIECQIMDWADDTAYSLNDLVDSITAGLLRFENVERWGAKEDLKGEEADWLNEILQVMRDRRAESRFGRKVGECVRACRIVERENFLSEKTNRYRFALEVDPTALRRAKFHKRLSRELVFWSPQLQQLEHKGDRILRQIIDVCAGCYLDPSKKGPRILPENTDRALHLAEEPEQRARLLCDYIAGMTDGYAVRTYKRLFEPDFGSIVDLG